MKQGRRSILKSASALGILAALGLISESAALAAENQAGFDAKNFGEAMKALGGPGTDSKDINLNAPEIAENGAVVPLSVVSAIPNTEAIYIFVEKNPNPLSAAFTIPAGTEPSIVTRVKMGESSRIYALVKADGKFYSTSRETKVTLGGCGG
ncbi:MAG: thiosulfate oxidation carrier protein SoxY [Pseudomonadota bacterium]